MDDESFRTSSKMLTTVSCGGYLQTRVEPVAEGDFRDVVTGVAMRAAEGFLGSAHRDVLHLGVTNRAGDAQCNAHQGLFRRTP